MLVERSYADGSRILHIGLPKTGTSTLQVALHGAREELGRSGVRYAGPLPTQHVKRSVEDLGGDVEIVLTVRAFASGATVVGDLAHLLVDPAAFAETAETPQSLDIDAAARLAYVFYQSGLRDAARPTKQ